MERIILSPGDRPARVEQVIAQAASPEKTVLLHTGTGKYFELNEAGKCIWEWSDGTHTVAEITQAICAEFEVDEATAREDVTELLADLAGEDLVRKSR